MSFIIDITSTPGNDEALLSELFVRFTKVNAKNDAIIRISSSIVLHRYINQVIFNLDLKILERFKLTSGQRSAILDNLSKTKLMWIKYQDGDTSIAENMVSWVANAEWCRERWATRYKISFLHDIRKCATFTFDMMPLVRHFVLIGRHLTHLSSYHRSRAMPCFLMHESGAPHLKTLCLKLCESYNQARMPHLMFCYRHHDGSDKSILKAALSVKMLDYISRSAILKSEPWEDGYKIDSLDIFSLFPSIEYIESSFCHYANIREIEFRADARSNNQSVVIMNCFNGINLKSIKADFTDFAIEDVHNCFLNNDGPVSVNVPINSVACYDILRKGVRHIDLLFISDYENYYIDMSEKLHGQKKYMVPVTAPRFSSGLPTTKTKTRAELYNTETVTSELISMNTLGMLWIQSLKKSTRRKPLVINFRTLGGDEKPINLFYRDTNDDILTAFVNKTTSTNFQTRYEIYQSLFAWIHILFRSVHRENFTFEVEAYEVYQFHKHQTQVASMVHIEWYLIPVALYTD